MRFRWQTYSHPSRTQYTPGPARRSTPSDPVVALCASFWRDNPKCAEKTFVLNAEETPPYSRNSTLIRERAVIGRREDRITYEETARRMRRDFQVKISPSAISRWTLGQLSAGQTPFEPRELQFSSVLCIDEVFVSVGGRKVLVLIAARLWQRLFCTPSWKAAILKASELPFSSSKSWGPIPKGIVSDLDKSYPGAISVVFPPGEKTTMLVSRHANRLEATGSYLHRLAKDLPPRPKSGAFGN